MVTQPGSSRVRSLLFLTLLVSAGSSWAQVKRTPVYQADVAEPGREAVVVKAELDPNTHAGRHTHPGDEISYVTEGEGELLVDGEPPRRLKAGDAFVVKTGKVHDLRDVGSTPLRLLGVYVVEKGKPLATPVK